MAADARRLLHPSRWSTRSRLTAAAAVVIAAALVAASLGTVLALRHSLLSSIDVAARDDAHDVAAQLARNGSSDSLEPPTPDAAVQVLGAQGEVVAASANAPSQPLVDVAGSTHGVIRATGPLPLPNSADAYHVAVLSIGGGSSAVLVALPSDDVSDATRQLTGVIVVGAPLLFAVLVVLAWLLIGRALAPMNALSRRQQEFVSDAAHELRTPLASMSSQLELAEGHDDAEVRRLLPQLAGEVRRMQSLVDGLLALVRTGNERTSQTDVDLDDVVAESVDRLRAHCDLPVDTTGMHAARLVGDRAALSRLVDNLLDNAARYATNAIEVSVTTDRTDAVLTVADDGPGIPAADRERVFGRFTRLDGARARDDGGAGLGLAIVRSVAGAHGGHVTVHDNGPGARFVVHLPLGAAGRG